MIFKFKLFSKTLLLFALTQALGFFLAFKILPEMGTVLAGSATGLNVWDFVYLIAIGVIFFVLASKYPRFGSVVYRIVLSLIIYSIIQAVISIWFSPLTATIAALVILIWFWVWRNVLFQDALMVLVIAGLGAILGLTLTPVTAIWVLVAFSVYDLVAVYVTGHMVKLAEIMVSARAIFGFVIPQSTTDFRANMKNVQPGEGFMILGSGDVLLPMLFSVSLIPISLSQAIIVATFSCLGLFATHLIFTNQKVRRPMAALPPIALLTIIGYVLSKFL